MLFCKPERFSDGAEKTKCFSEKPNESVTVTVEDTVTVTETVEDIITPPTPSKGRKAKKVDPFVAFAGKIPAFSFVGTIRR